MDKVERPTVLVVEDSADFLELLAEGLSCQDLNVAAVPNGLEALRYLDSHAPPIAIVLDVQMPIMDGWAFSAIKLGIPRLRDIPVIIYSSERDLALIARDLGAVAYVSKADGPRRLLAELHRCCPHVTVPPESLPAGDVPGAKSRPVPH